MQIQRRFILISIIGFLVFGCARSTAHMRTTGGQGVSAGKTWYGMASWYGRTFDGRRTASGEIFDMHKYTAAHRTLPFGTRVRVTNPRTGRHTTVRINDRGPFKSGREIDLSYAAARDIGILKTGVEQVRIEITAN
jgi:rare lipoprotein A